MSKYSDPTTVGGQVIAHRFRMMRQNASMIGKIGKWSFALTFVLSLFYRWRLNEIWNYLCCLKAIVRSNMTTLPRNLWSHSTLWSVKGQWREFSDTFIAHHPTFLQLKADFEHSLIVHLKLSILLSLTAMVLMILLTKYFGKSLSDQKELVSGQDYVEGKKIRKYIKEKSDIALADSPYPLHTECRHTLLTGTTGSGKTNIMIELLDQIVEKNEKVILVDTVGTFQERYYQKDRDILLNPLEDKSVSWSFLNECTDDTLIKNVASCLIDRGHTHDPFWEEAAQIVFVETAKRALLEKKTTSEFLDLLLKVSLKEMQNYLSNSYAHSLMDPNADKMALSIRATLIKAVSSFDILKESDEHPFRLKDWIQDSHQKGILFLSCTPAQRATLVPLITAWLSLATDYLLQTAPTSQRTWFFIDELHNLKRLPRLETSLAEIRKFGGCFVMGTQMISQLNSLYGHDGARTLTGLCGTKVVMTIPEPDTAKYMSHFLGEKEELSTSEAISYGAHTMRDGVNIAQKTEKKHTVPYTDIMNLKTGEAFIKFSGIDRIVKTTFKFHELNKGKASKENVKPDKDKESCPEETSEDLTFPLPDKNQFVLYGFPITDLLLSKPIYLFDKEISEIGNLLAYARKKGEKIIVFENDLRMYESHFQAETDLFIDHHQTEGYAWDFLYDINHNYIHFIRTLIENTDLEKDDRKNVEKYLFKFFTRIKDMTTDFRTSNILDILLFKPYKTVHAHLEHILSQGEEDSLKNFSDWRDYLALQFHYLKSPSDKEMSIRNYLNSEKGILFMACHEDMKEVSDLIFKEAKIESVLKIMTDPSFQTFSHHTLVYASPLKSFFDTQATIFASFDEIKNRHYLRKIMKIEETTSSFSYAVKCPGTAKFTLLT